MEKAKIKEYVNINDNIGEVITKYPYLSEVFLDFGLHCVGCFANAFDTIEGASIIHGMTKSDIKNLLNNLNRAIYEYKKFEKSEKNSKN